MHTRKSHKLLATAVATLSVLALAACSSSDDSSPGSSNTGGTGGAANTGGSGGTTNTGGTGGTSNTGGSGGTTNTGGTGGSGGTSNTGGTGGTAAAGSAGASGSAGSAGSQGTPMPTDASIIFLHHSTGGVIWGGGVDSAVESLNTSNGTSYSITELAYPNSPYPWANYPYDYWHLWVDSGGQASAEGVPTLESFTSTYDVIVFKHCYPVSGIGPDTGSPDISSEDKTLENYKLQYEAIKDRLHGFPDNRFVVWTGAALVQASSSSDQGQRSREFFTWVKQQWDEPGDNIFVWDFFELETEGGNFLLDSYSASSGDSHPNDTFAQTVAPNLAQRVVDVIEGFGDTGSITGD